MGVLWSSATVDEALAACEAAGVAFLAYAPFTGPFGSDGEPLPRPSCPGLDAVAREREISRKQAIVAPEAAAQGAAQT